MAFLDNSGDIILDAVLTDTGRFRLAKADGSFRISKFSFGDDEIDYSLYRNSNHPNGAHPSGSAYYDLSILQTPVLESFTNNTSMLKSKLVTYNQNNLLYLPILKVNDRFDLTKMNGTTNEASGTFVVAVDKATEKNLVTSTSVGVINGATGGPGNVYIRLDQGLDTTEIPALFSLDSNLVEKQFIIELDSQLGKITTKDGALAKPSFIDDDNIASYYISAGVNPGFVKNDWAQTPGYDDQGNSNYFVLSGPKGSYLQFSVLASINLQTSTFMFNKIGGTDYDWSGDSDKTIKFIDSSVRVTGITTGYRIDIPIRFVKCPDCTV